MLDPILAARLAEAVGDVYADAEVTLLKMIADRLTRGLESPQWAERQLIEVQNLRIDARQYVSQVDRVATAEIESAVATSRQVGVRAAQQDIDRVQQTPVTFGASGVIDTHAVVALTAEAVGAARSTNSYILRSTDDAYRRTIAEVSGRVITGTQTRQQAAQQALNNLARQGITGFVDARQRNWQASSYVEMALRTSTHRAMIQGHTDRLQAAGLDLVLISSHPNPAPMCQPYEGKILSLSGNVRGDVTVTNALDGQPMTVNVWSSMAEAEMNGLHHPNAILGGSQSIDTLGGVFNGVRAWYEGPSVDVTSASGIRFTVSPNHPVLTDLGWIPAKALRVGHNMFRTLRSGGGSGASVSEEAFQDVPPSTEQVFRAVNAVGRRSTVPTSADYLHDDARFIKGEIDVVLSDSRLLLVGNADGVKAVSEDDFVRSSVESVNSSSSGAEPLSELRVDGPIGRALADYDVARSKSAKDSCVADAESLTDILGGMPSEVELDNIIDVQWNHFEGHAYDFQTGTGAYALNGLIVHNCRHTHTAFVPGASQPAVAPYDPKGYENSQKQRYLERGVKAARRNEAVQQTAADRKAARARTKAWQSRAKEHAEQTGIPRRLDRERLQTGDPLKADTPKLVGARIALPEE